MLTDPCHLGPNGFVVVADIQGVRNIECVRSLAEMTGVIEHIDELMTESGFSRRDILSVRIAIEEAVLNSFKHAYRNAPNSPVILRHSIAGDRIWIEVEDQGAGFNPATVPDPTSPENWERESGRGIFLMRNYMSSVRYNATGNCVTLFKECSTVTPERATSCSASVVPYQAEGQDVKQNEKPASKAV